jgi:hypothetical protein
MTSTESFDAHTACTARGTYQDVPGSNGTRKKAKFNCTPAGSDTMPDFWVFADANQWFEAPQVGLSYDIQGAWKYESATGKYRIEATTINPLG